MNFDLNVTPSEDIRSGSLHDKKLYGKFILMQILIIIYYINYLFFE